MKKCLFFSVFVLKNRLSESPVERNLITLNCWRLCALCHLVPDNVFVYVHAVCCRDVEKHLYYFGTCANEYTHLAAAGE